jgi:hypothetical protein
VGHFHPQTLPVPLLQARQNLFRVGTWTDLGKGLFDPALFVDQIRDTAGKTGVASTIGFSQHCLSITQQRKLETVPIGKGLVRLNPIKTSPSRGTEFAYLPCLVSRRQLLLGLEGRHDFIRKTL